MKEINDIEREDLKKYLTKGIIVRIDYMPLSDNLVDEMVSELSKDLFENEYFSDVFEGTINSIDIQLNNPEISNNQSFFNINNYTKIKSIEILRFLENNVYVKFIINKHFTYIDINCGMKYISYEEYIKIFNRMIEKIYENDIKIKRIGFRKFNEFFVKYSTNILQYLNEDFFKYNYEFAREKQEDKIEDLIAERKYTFLYNEKQINLITHLSQGMLAGEKVRRAGIDIDVSINDLEVLKEITTQKQVVEKLNDINLIIFRVFKNMLSKNFLNLLTKEDGADDTFIGVKENE